MVGGVSFSRHRSFFSLASVTNSRELRADAERRREALGQDLRHESLLQAREREERR